MSGRLWLTFAQQKALHYAALPIDAPGRIARKLPRRDVREKLDAAGLTYLDDRLGWTLTDAGRKLLEAIR